MMLLIMGGVQKVFQRRSEGYEPNGLSGFNHRFIAKFQIKPPFNVKRYPLWNCGHIIGYNG